MATTIPNIVNSLTGSTLDIQKLATDLVAAVRAPQQSAIDTKMTKTQAVISSVGKVVSAASSLQQGLSIYNPRTLTYLPQGGTNSTFTFHPSSPARAVDFSFQINQVATINSVALPGITDVEFAKNFGKLSIYAEPPGTSPIFPSIDLGATDSSGNRLYNTLADLQAAIKDQTGFDASIVSTGGSTPKNYLTITHGTGVSNRFSIKLDKAPDLVPTNLGSGTSFKLNTVTDSLLTNSQTGLLNIYDVNSTLVGTLDMNKYDTVDKLKIGLSTITTVPGLTIDKGADGKLTINASGSISVKMEAKKWVDSDPTAVTMSGITDAFLQRGATGVLNVYPKDGVTPIASFDMSKYSSLSSLRSAINAVSGFSAPGGSTDPFVISHTTGLSLTPDEIFARIEPASLTPSVAVSSGVDAIVAVGSETFTSKSNTFPDLVPDLIINIDPKTATDPPPTEHITTSSNTQRCKEALADIVTGFNMLMTTINNELKYDKNISKRGGLNNNSIARSFLWQMRDLTTNPVKVSTSRSVSLADVGVSTNLDGTLSLDEAKLDAVINSKPGVLEAVLSTGVVGGKTIKGAIERMNDMASVIVAPTSSFNALALTAQKVDLPKIEAEATKLDDAMTALQAKYLQQFSAMQTAVQASKNTQDSLSQSMSSWSSGLKG